MIPATAAALFYLAVLADSLLHAGSVVSSVGFGAAVGGVLFVIALRRAARGMLGWSLLIAGIVYVAAVEKGGGGVDGTAPLVAAGLFLSAELARWSFELRVRINGEELLVVRRAGALVALAIGAAAASALVVAASAIGAPRALASTALGAAAAAAAAGIGVWLARRA